jgi:DNA-binding MarR family transcriptional regulator
MVTVADLQTKPGHLIRRAQQVAVALFLDEAAECDITPVQYAALVAIAQHAGLDASRLSTLIAFDRSTLGGVLDRLEKKGLITRAGAEADRRVKLLAITAAGRTLLREIEPAVARTQARILAPLSGPEQAQLVRLLAKMVGGNNESSRAPMRAAAAEDMLHG